MILNCYRIVKEEDQATELGDIVIVKKDLKGAFSIIFYEASGVSKLSMEMTGYKVIMTSWSGTLAVFQVINRALVYELKRAIKGHIIVYTYDILMVTLQKHLEHDSCSNLMGSDFTESFIGF